MGRGGGDDGHQTAVHPSTKSGALAGALRSVLRPQPHVDCPQSALRRCRQAGPRTPAPFVRLWRTPPVTRILDWTQQFLNIAGRAWGVRLCPSYQPTRRKRFRWVMDVKSTKELSGAVVDGWLHL